MHGPGLLFNESIPANSIGVALIEFDRISFFVAQLVDARIVLRGNVAELESVYSNLLARA